MDQNIKIDPQKTGQALDTLDPHVKTWVDEAKEVVAAFVGGLKDAGSSLHITVEVKISGLYPEKKAE